MRSSSKWLKQILPTQIWVVTRHQYGISALVSQTSLRGRQVVTSRNVGFISQAAPPLIQYIALCKKLLLTLNRGGVGG